MSIRAFNIGAGADDQTATSNGSTTYSGVTYRAHTSTAITVIPRRSLSGGSFSTDAAFLRWDTSVLPDDAVIQSATLRVHPTAKTDTDARSLVADYYAWNATSTDWTTTAPASPVLSASLASLTTGQANDIQLSDLSGISKTGITSLRLHISGGQSTGPNVIELSSSENTTNPGPRLIVEYTSASEETANGGKQVAVIPVAGPLDDAYAQKGPTYEWPPGSYQHLPNDSTVQTSKEWNDQFQDRFLRNGLLRFDVTMLPSSLLISSAKLKVRVTVSRSDEARGFSAGWYAWSGTFTDSQAVAETSAIPNMAISTLSTGLKEFALSNPSPNIAGQTYASLRLHISGGQPGSGDPNADRLNQVYIASYENTTLPAPELVVYYAAGPTANFTHTVSGVTASFTDTSTPATGKTITGWSWQFGPAGATSTLQNPSYVYPSAGTYSVTLTVAQSDGQTGTVTKAVTVTNVAPTASFSVSKLGLTATFTDQSTDPEGPIASRSWNFGDGNTSNVTNPVHTYETSGTYTASLTVTDSGGATNTTSQSVTVHVPTAAYTFSRTGLEVAFTDQSTTPAGVITSRSWDFGDGTTSTATNPAHAYASAGTYTVVLTIQDDSGGQDTEIKSIAVSPPGAGKGALSLLVARRTTTLSGPVDASQDTYPLADLTYWPRSGEAFVEQDGEQEKITWTNKSSPNGPGNLTGVVRGAFGTIATSHASGAMVGLLNRHDGGVTARSRVALFPTNASLTLRELRRHSDHAKFAWADFNNLRERAELEITGPPTSSGNLFTTLEEAGSAVTTPVLVTARKEVASLTLNAGQTSAGSIAVTLNDLPHPFYLGGARAVQELIVTSRATTTGSDALRYYDAANTAVDLGISISVNDTLEQIAYKIRSATYSGWTTGGSGTVVTFTATSAGPRTLMGWIKNTANASATPSTTVQGSPMLSAPADVALFLRSRNYPGWQTGGTGATVTWTALGPGVRAGANSYDPGGTGATSTTGMTTPTEGARDTAEQVAAAIRAQYAANTHWSVGGSGNLVTWTSTTNGPKQDATFNPGSTGTRGTIETVEQGSADIVGYVRDSKGVEQKRRILANIATTTDFYLEPTVSGAGTTRAIVSFWGSFGEDPKELIWRVTEVDLTEHPLGEVAAGVTAESATGLTWDVYTDELLPTNRGEKFYRDHNALGELIGQIHAPYLLDLHQARQDLLIQGYRQAVIPGEPLVAALWLRFENVPAQLPAKPLFVTCHHADNTVTELRDVTGVAGISGTQGWQQYFYAFTVPEDPDRAPVVEVRFASRDISRGTFVIQEIANSPGYSVDRSGLYAPSGSFMATYDTGTTYDRSTPAGGNTPKPVPSFVHLGHRRKALESRYDLPPWARAWTRHRAADTLGGVSSADWHTDPALVPDLAIVQIDGHMDSDGLTTGVVPEGFPRVEYRVTVGNTLHPLLLTLDKTEFPGGVLLYESSEWYPNPKVLTFENYEGSIFHVRQGKPIGYMPKIALMAFRPETVKYIGERWHEDFYVELYEELLRIRFRDKPEFEQQSPPQNDEYGRTGYWKTNTVSAEVIEVSRLIQ